jgi:hypothetical protein
MKTFSTVNRGGSAEDNPILDQESLVIKLYKHDSTEAIRKCWVQVGKKIFSNLTDLVTSTREELSVNVTAGVHLQAGASPVKNTIHFTTSGHRHAKNDLWVVTRPAVMIALDGYNAEDPERPLIYPYYKSG